MIPVIKYVSAEEALSAGCRAGSPEEIGMTSRFSTLQKNQGSLAYEWRQMRAQNPSGGRITVQMKSSIRNTVLIRRQSSA